MPSRDAAIVALAGSEQARTARPAIGVDAGDAPGFAARGSRRCIGVPAGTIAVGRDVAGDRRGLRRARVSTMRGERLVRALRDSCDAASRAASSATTEVRRRRRQLRVGEAGGCNADSRSGSARRAIRGARGPRPAGGWRRWPCLPPRGDARLPRREATLCRGHRRTVAQRTEAAGDELPELSGCARDRQPAARLCRRGTSSWPAGSRQSALRAWRRDAFAEHQAFEQRVAGEPVAAVQAGRRDFAAGPEAGQRGRALGVGRDAAHVESAQPS